MSIPDTHKAVRLHPKEHATGTIKVETLPTPKIEDPDDAIVKIKLSGLCGSDLHGYRGHEVISGVITTGHEFVGEVVALGTSYSLNAAHRPPLYSTLKVGDKVVSPFTSSCAECHFCRIGFTSRCKHQLLFGTVPLPGGQAQYVRVPKAGGTLFVIAPAESSGTPSSSAALSAFSDTSLLLLADILPTGYFAAVQTVQHPKILPIVRGERYPLASLRGLPGSEGLVSVMQDPMWPQVNEEDRMLTLAVVGLGPVGICAIVSLLDLLAKLKTSYRIVAIDLVQARKDKALSVYNALLGDAKGKGEFVIASPDEATKIVNDWTGNVGCNAVLEIVGNGPALTLSYALIRNFGLIVSAGVHQSPPIPFTGRQLYNKNVAFEFGRCPVRTLFPLAADLLRRRQDIFGGVGTETSLVERVVGLDDASDAFAKFERGEWGKVVFDPWK